MRLATFKGGIHPYEGKEISENCAIKKLDFDGEFVFPLSQGIGAPAKPVVAVGDRVLAGQMLADAGGFISAVVNSSVSGTVTAIENRLTTMGNMCMSVVVESDGKYETIEGVGTENNFKVMPKEEIRALVKKAGIVGMGGAGFPTHVKLTPKDDNAIDYIIANGSECEPMLTNDYRLMLEEGERIVGGVEVCLQLFPNAKGVIAIENNKPEAIKHMQELVKDKPKIEVLVLKTKYPEGGERQLIYAVTGRMINSSMLPADVGCVVDNVATLAAVYDAVAKSTPIMEKVITITGDAVFTPSNVKIRIGTSYKRILDACGGLKEAPGKIIAGGPMMGMAMFDMDVPVQKNTSALCVFLHDQVAESEHTHCIRCGHCINACPNFLAPPLLAKAAEKRDLEKFVELNGMECVGCGCCSYVCAARRPLTQWFKEMRGLVMADRRKKQAEAKAKEEAAKAAEAAKAEEKAPAENKEK